MKSGIHAFEEMTKKDESGEQRLYQSKWKRKEGRELKEDKRKNWHKRGGYESVIFVPCTKESILLKRLQENIDKSKLKIIFPPYYFIRPFAEFLLFTIWVIFLKASTGAANMSIKPLYGQTVYITSFFFLY